MEWYGQVKGKQPPTSTPKTRKVQIKLLHFATEAKTVDHMQGALPRPARHKLADLLQVALR